MVAEIETDKATMEYQSDLDGVLLQILVGDGESADLGAVIALVGERRRGGGRRRRPSGEPAASGDADAAAPEADAGEQPEAVAAQPTSSESAAGGPHGRPAAEAAPAAPGRGAPRGTGALPPRSGPLKASPIARKIADENGLDLRELAGRGSGPDGRIVRADVERLIERQGRREDLPPTPPQARAQAPVVAAPPPHESTRSSSCTKMQRIMARRMARVEGDGAALLPHGRGRHGPARSSCARS